MSEQQQESPKNESESPVNNLTNQILQGMEENSGEPFVDDPDEGPSEPSAKAEPAEDKTAEPNATAESEQGGEEAEPEPAAEPVESVETSEKQQPPKADFDAIIQREKELRAQVEAEREALKQKELEVAKKTEMVELAEKNPTEYLRRLGWSEERILEYLVDPETAKPAKEEPKITQEDIDRRVQELLEAKLSEKEKQEQSSRNEENYRQQIYNLTKDSDKYPLLDVFYEGEDVVGALFDEAVNHHARTGEVLQPEQVLQGVYAKLEAKAKKLSQFGSKPVAAPKEATKKAETETKTISSDMHTPTGLGMSQEEFDELSTEEQDEVMLRWLTTARNK